MAADPHLLGTVGTDFGRARVGQLRLLRHIEDVDEEQTV